MENSNNDGWLNGGLPFIDHVFPNGKTGRENARECLKEWALRADGERRIAEACKVGSP